MKRIGIVTLCDLRNYGNRLQLYALSRVVEKLNCKPFAILYGKEKGEILKNVIKNSRFMSFCSEFLWEISRGSKIGVAYKKCKRVRLFSSFSHKIESEIISRDKKNIDYYICGSDQIWNPNFAGTPKYFATFANKEKRISYAASFGIGELPEEFAKKYKSYLNDMKYISVREEKGVKIVRELVGKEARVVVDPTLMLDANEWKMIANKPRFNVPAKYILTYFLGNLSEHTQSYIKELAEENNLEIISLHNCDMNDYWYRTGPAEFIWLIENASLVCTDSFHASVFSILMDSPFIAFRRISENNDMSSRFESLLEMFKLKDRFAENIQGGTEFKKEYHHIPEILNYERAKSIKFLKEALNHEE